MTPRRQAFCVRATTARRGVFAGGAMFARLAIAVIFAAMITQGHARAQDGKKFPDWSGQWRVMGGDRWDPTKPAGREQEAPLTGEYLALFEVNVADQEAGGPGLDTRMACLPPGMPRMMTALAPMEFVFTPAITYMLFENVMPRRIYTDGRAWPSFVEPAFAGYSIGTWIDEDGDGVYDVLEIETRNLKGPRAFESSGLPLHKDAQTVVRERIWLEKTRRNLLFDEITTTDNALMRPWTVTKTYRREFNPFWYDNNCTENNPHVLIGKENYFLSADRTLMPSKKNQAPPDLRYFRPLRKAQ
jgi:hypothetical protein